MALTYFLYNITIFLIIKYSLADKPCAARLIPTRSVVCICNSTYCDDIIRDVPDNGSFVAYTTSANGLRFSKTFGKLEKISKPATFVLDATKTYQRIEGFGGSVTDSAGINWKSVPKILQDYLIKSYFGEHGLEYNMLRVPIGGTDFSTHPYSYNEQPTDDLKLSNYTLAYEDYAYKIPMIKSMMNMATTPIQIVASTWSPPTWMKTNNGYGGQSRLKLAYYQTYADYHLKFLEKYQANGIPIWGITTTNEPSFSGINKLNSLGWSINEMGDWIVNNLGPTIRNSTFRNVKIIAGDDQLIVLPIWMSVMFLKYPNAVQYVDGISVHYFLNRFIPASLLDIISNIYPKLFIISTKASVDVYFWQSTHVALGSWYRAKSYITNIMETLNHNVVSWIDWNLCLDLQGGPNWAKLFEDAPIIVDPKHDEFIKQPTFYAIGHFSKFIPRGSMRIKATEHSGFFQFLHVAFVTPRNTIVFVVYNRGYQTPITLNYKENQANLLLEPHSITTVEFKK